MARKLKITENEKYTDRKSDEEGKSVDLGGCGIIKERIV